MAQSALASIIDHQPIAQAAAEASTGRIMLQAVQPTMNGGFLTDFFRDIDNGTRVTTLLDRLHGLTLEERDKAIRSYKDVNKIDGPKGKPVVDPVASTRASEVKSLWAALNVIGMRIDEFATLGYHKAVSTARSVLNEVGVDTDGDKKLSSEEKKDKREKDVKADALAQALVDNPIQEGESMLDHMTRVAGVLEEAQREALDNMDDQRAESIVKRLIEKENEQVLAKIIHLLDAHLRPAQATE